MKEAMEANMGMTFEEGIKMVYCPIVFTYAAFEYLSYGMDFAAKLKMPWQARTRRIKAWIVEYKSNVFQAIGAELMPEIYERLDALRDYGDECFDDLEFELKKEEMKRHGILKKKEWRMYCNLLVALLLMRYALRYEVASEAAVKARTGKQMRMVDECTVNIVNEVVYMVKGYDVQMTDAISATVKSIARIMDALTDVKIVKR